MSERSEGTRPLDPFGLTGSVLDRKYRIDKVVAEGGFGVVFAGHHLVLDTRVAVKVLKTEQVQGARHGELIARFLTEARTMARLRHPHIVSVLDSGVHHVAEGDAGVPWIVFEWLQGDTLRAELERRRGKGGRSPEACLELMRAALEAIAYAHSKGVAHRDIKPSNIVLVKSGRSVVPRVLDFGIAKVMERDEQPGTGETATRGGRGSFSTKYAAPEQVSGARTGPWTDVHALGLLLSEMLTDKPAYPSDDSTEICSFVFDARRPTPGRFGVDVGPWEPILARALALKPTERHATALDLLHELEAALGQPRASLVPSPPSAPSSDDVPRSFQEAPDSPRTLVDRTFETLVTGPAQRPTEPPSRSRAVLGMSAFVVAIAGASIWLSGSHKAPAQAHPEVTNVSARTIAAASSVKSAPAGSVQLPVSSSAPAEVVKPPGTPTSAMPISRAKPRAQKRQTLAARIPPKSQSLVSEQIPSAKPSPSAAPPRPVVSSSNVPAPYLLE